MDIREFAFRKGLKDVYARGNQRAYIEQCRIDKMEYFMRGTQWTPEQRATLEERENGS